MNALYWVILFLAGIVIIAFYAVSLRPARSFSPAGGKRSRWARRVGYAILFVALAAIYVWLFRRMAG